MDPSGQKSSFSDNQEKGLGTTREDRKQGAKSYMTAHPQIILPKLLQSLFSLVYYLSAMGAYPGHYGRLIDQILSLFLSRRG